MCQACVNEDVLTQETFDKMKAFLVKYPNAEFGPAHLVLSDCNMEDYFIKDAIGCAKGALLEGPTSEDLKYRSKEDWYLYNNPDVLMPTIAFLEELLAISEGER